MADRKLTVRIIGNDASLRRAFANSSRGAKNFDRDMGRVTRGAIAGSGALGGLGKSLAFASGGFITAAAAVGFVGAAFTELKESQKVAAQTNAVLQSTGAIAGVTAAHVEALGNALLRKTGIDDEAIRSAENLLLTFTNVRNVLGEGNDVFDQATQAILDMSVAMGEDLQSATVRIGKALQDPIRGVTALRRVGVQLTVSQEAQIKSLLKTGRAMDAQKIILAELNREFGGSAAAAGRVQPWNRLRETVRNVSAELARGLLPQITDTVNRLQAWFDNTSNVERLQRQFNTAVRVTGDVLRGLAGTFKAVIGLLGGFKNTLIIVVGAWAGFKAAGVAAALAVSTANVVAAGVTASAWKAALIATGWGAFAIAAGIAATYVITHWEKVRKFFERFWIAIKVGALQAVAVILEAFSHVPGQLGQDASTARDAILANIEGLREDFYRLGLDSGEAFAIGAAKATQLGPGPGMTLRIPKTDPRRGATAPDIEIASGSMKAVKTAADKAQESFANLLDALNLGLERAKATVGLGDDLKALKAIEAALRARLKIVKDSVDIQRQIFQNEQEQASLQRQATNATQFFALGLSPTGGERTPGLKGLRRQLGNFEDAVKGTFLDTEKTRSVLSTIRKLLAGGFGKMSETVRATVRDMLRDLNQQLRDAKPISKGRALNADSILAGLGLDRNTYRLLKSRLVDIGAGGRVMGGPTSGAFGVPIAGRQGLVINGPITVVSNDPDDLLRKLQRKAGRVATQTTGHNAGNASGINR